MKLPRTNHPGYCPVPQGINTSLPLLLQVEGNTVVVLDKKAVRKQHKAVWKVLGLQDQSYTPHSLCRGGATFYAEQGLPLEDTKKLGLWRSDAIKLYLKKLNVHIKQVQFTILAGKCQQALMLRTTFVKVILVQVYLHNT